MPSPLRNCDCFGSLTINGYDLSNPCCCVVDLSDIFLSGPVVRGSNRVVGGRGGQIPYPREIDERRYQILLTFVGEFDRLGAAQSAIAGLKDNVDEFKSMVCQVGVLLPATATHPDGSTWTANLQYESFEGGTMLVSADRASAKGVLELNLPKGAWEISGS